MVITIGARRRRAPTPVERFGNPVPGSIHTIIRAYKSAATHRINQIRNAPAKPAETFSLPGCRIG